MKIRIPFFTLLLTFLALQYAYSQELGEQVYKEVTVNGAKLYKWVVYNSLSEYDENGNLIHSKVFDNDGNGMSMTQMAIKYMKNTLMAMRHGERMTQQKQGSILEIQRGRKNGKNMIQRKD
ncbi:MAG: hypothetical protein IKR40_07970 [Treponema sp.]|nr:hypothetical protein [Treponema sp.]